MKHEKLFKMLNTLDIPVTYDHFESCENVTPPFLAYRENVSNIFTADNNAFFKSPEYEIELVTEQKNVELERKIEELLIENNIPFEREGEVWDSTEKIYHNFFEI